MIPKSHQLPIHTGALLPDNPWRKRKAIPSASNQPIKRPKPADLYAESFLLSVRAYEKDKHYNLARRGLPRPTPSDDPKIKAVVTLTEHARLRPLVNLCYPQIAPRLIATSIEFEPVTSDIIIRGPYFTADAVRIYIPSIAVGLAVERLEIACRQMGNGGMYSIESVLGFLGEKCACGGFHWEDMGWRSGEGSCWPGKRGVVKQGVKAAIQQLRLVLIEGWVPKVVVDESVVGVV
jgi:hypothetical protein